MMSARTRWQAAAKVMDRVGARLSHGYAGRAISSTEIREEFEHEARGEFGRGVEWLWQPSDYCYNSVNRGKESMTCPIFLRRQDGCYEYLGLNSRSYSGPVWWTDKNGHRTQVGTVVNGHVTLQFDPRRQ